MKKLLAILLALVMVLPLVGVASASVTDNTRSFSVYTGASTQYYNSNSQITVVLSLRDISFGTDDGISALEFDLFYDKNRLTPVVCAIEDADGDVSDFTHLMTTDPGSWEGFGVHNADNGSFNLVFSDIEGAAAIKEDDTLVVEIPFLVKDGVRTNDIVFNFDNVIAYNKDMEYMVEISLNSVIVKYSVQPDEAVALPNDAIGVQIAGYRHDINNVVYYAEDPITVGSYVRKYCDSTANQDKMSTFAILIADLNGIVTYVDTDVSSSSDKSAVMISAGSYVIGVCSANEADYQKILSQVEVGKRITLYNVNIGAAGNTDTAIELINAGFTVSDASENQPPFVGGDSPDAPAPSEPVQPEIMVGDLNGNGEIDSVDYISLKRAYFGKYDVTDIRVADINGNGSIDSLDYVFVKRAYFGKFAI